MDAHELTQKHCVPCEGGVDPMKPEEYLPLLKAIPTWKTLDEKSIEKEFSFQDFKAAIVFINAVAEIAEKEGHHPDIFLHSWNKVKLMSATHAIGGLSQNDFILAAKIDSLTV